MRYRDWLPAHVDLAAIESIHTAREQWVSQPKKGFLRYRVPYEVLREFRAEHREFTTDTVTIGAAEEVSDENRNTIEQNLRGFMPWRKGPFSIFGIGIDAEWQSNRKWARLQAHLPDLHDKTIADIGCSNGYYIFRMMAHKPRWVLGFEPAMQPYYCGRALLAMAGCDNGAIDLLGVEHLTLFAETFDVIFLMGVIYHRAAPLDCLRTVRQALKPGGTLIFESQAIPGDEPVALFAEKTYGKAPGTYFIPTGACAVNWLKRAGFSSVDLFHAHPMNGEEQRRTDWMQFESYEHFIDPANQDKTVEGYPAPWRIFIKAGVRAS
jgi:tRNA (mo5U34)-methyltransferase